MILKCNREIPRHMASQWSDFDCSPLGILFEKKTNEMKVLTSDQYTTTCKNRGSQKLTARLNCEYIPLQIYFKANAILCNNSQGFCSFVQLSSSSVMN